VVFIEQEVGWGPRIGLDTVEGGKISLVCARNLNPTFQPVEKSYMKKTNKNKTSTIRSCRGKKGKTISITRRGDP
jgi:hypothetical protein